jgi:spermidine/putrescine-binding protein
VSYDSENPGVQRVDLATYRLTRRRFLQRTAGAGMGMSIAGILAACGGGSEESAGGGAANTSGQASGGGGGGSETINMLTWEGYHRQPWLDEFKQATGITVNAKNVGSPAEMFASTKANPSQWDLVLNTSGWFDQYVADDLLIPVDESKAPNVKLISDAFPWRDATTVNDTNYGILYNWGDQPLGWNADKVPGSYDISAFVSDQDTPDDWNILWDPQFKGLITVFDDPTSVEPMIPLALGFPDPFNLDDKQFDAFTKKLNDLRPQLKRLTTGFTDQVNAFVSGEAVIGYINIIQVQVDANKENIPVTLNHLVRQGTPAWSDNYAITKEGGANKLDAIYKFIDYTHTVPWLARFTADSANSGTLSYEQATSDEAVNAGLTKEKLDISLIPATQAGEEFFKKMIFFKAVENLDARLKAWDEFKLGIGA